MQMYATHLALLSNSMGAQKNSLGGKQESKWTATRRAKRLKREKVMITDFDLYNFTKAKKI